MDSRKIVLKETAIVAIGEVICCGIMVGVFALLGYYDLSVLLGALIGGILTIVNFFFMAISSSLAADKAVEQDVAAGKKIIQLSRTVRLLVLAVVMFAFAKSGICNTIALVLPLAFFRPVMMVGEFFRKKE